MLSRELLTYIVKRRHVSPFRLKGDSRREQKVLQSGVVEVLGKGPGKTCPFCPVQVLPDGRSPHSAA
ncbi:MAG: hypothetical protein A4E58_01545 [Syntrophorhabdus sp. PtaB.Bin006]|nr:MAG: hypothetical protein A4E58_01545 [Syntrophorhabdus sp. PtaB.Bin006]